MPFSIIFHSNANGAHYIIVAICTFRWYACWPAVCPSSAYLLYLLYKWRPSSSPQILRFLFQFLSYFFALCCQLFFFVHLTSWCTHIEHRLNNAYTYISSLRSLCSCSSSPLTNDIFFVCPKAASVALIHQIQLLYVCRLAFGTCTHLQECYSKHFINIVDKWKCKLSLLLWGEKTISVGNGNIQSVADNENTYTLYIHT